MNYHPMLPVVDEWFLWVLVLLVPLLALVSLTACIVLHREYKTATPAKYRFHRLVAGFSTLLVLFILWFMLFNGLRMEANKSNAAENLKMKYDISSVTWKTPDGKEVNPTGRISSNVIMVSYRNNSISAFSFKTDPATAEPQLEDIAEGVNEDNFSRIPAETLLR